MRLKEGLAAHLASCSELLMSSDLIGPPSSSWSTRPAYAQAWSRTIRKGNAGEEGNEIWPDPLGELQQIIPNRRTDEIKASLLKHKVLTIIISNAHFLVAAAQGLMI